MRPWLLNTICAGAIWALIFFALYTWFDTPLVQVSNSTAECVQVIPADAGTCVGLPKNYKIEYVK